MCDAYRVCARTTNGSQPVGSLRTPCGGRCASRAATAILRACRAWFAKRCAATVVSTLLVQPYFIYYGLAWLILPVIYLCVDGRVHGVWTRVERLIIGLAWVLPLPAFLTVFKPSIGQ